MIFRRITVENFMCFLGKHSIEVGEGVTVVVAEYDGAEHRSNRGGKSAIAVDAPMFAMFGRSRTGKVEDVVHRSVVDEDCWAEVEVQTSTGEIHTVRHCRTAAGRTVRTLDGAEVKQEDLNRFVTEELLGLTYDEYVLTNAFVQGDIHSFMNLSPAEKRRVISPWFRTDRWAPRCELAKQLLNEAKANLRAVEMEAEQLIDADPVRLEEKLLASENEQRDLEYLVECKIKALAVAQAELEDVDVLKEQQVAVRCSLRRAEQQREEEIHKTKDSLRRTSKYVESLEAERDAAEIREKRLSAFDGADQRLQEALNIQAELQTDFGGLINEYSRLEQIRQDLLATHAKITENRDGVCPLLREPCDRVARDEAEVNKVVTEGRTVKGKIQKLERKISEMRDNIGEIEDKVTQARNDIRDVERLRKLPSLEQVTVQLERAQSDLLAAERRLEEVSGDSTASQLIESASEKLDSLDSLIANIDRSIVDRLEEELRDLKAELRSMSIATSNIRADLEIHRRALERTEELKAVQSELWTRVADLMWTHYAFSAVGIPSREMENAFGVAEDAMNGVLAGMGTKLRVRFSPTRELKEWEPACLACGTTFPKGTKTHVCNECGVARQKKRRDELRMEVLDGDNISSFSADSGGGKVLLSMGVRFGLARLPGMVRSVRCEHALIDEPDGMLDDPNRDALHRLLRERLRTVGIRQAILVTHAPVREEFDKVIEVVRHEDQDRSEVRNV